MRGTGDLFEAGLLQRSGERGQILNSKFDFDFVRHAEILTAETPRMRRKRDSPGGEAARSRRACTRLGRAGAPVPTRTRTWARPQTSIPADGTSSCAVDRALPFSVS